MSPIQFTVYFHNNVHQILKIRIVIWLALHGLLIYIILLLIFELESSNVNAYKGSVRPL